MRNINDRLELQSWLHELPEEVSSNGSQVHVTLSQRIQHTLLAPVGRGNTCGAVHTLRYMHIHEINILKYDQNTSGLERWLGG